MVAFDAYLEVLGVYEASAVRMKKMVKERKSPRSDKCVGVVVRSERKALQVLRRYSAAVEASFVDLRKALYDGSSQMEKEHNTPRAASSGRPSILRALARRQ